MTVWAADSEYMAWAKLHSAARFNLASSGVADASLADLRIADDDLALTGPAGYGYPPLLEAIAAHAGVVSENVVAVSGGTSMANHLALAALLAPGDEALVETPAYTLMAAVARYRGATVADLPRRAENDFVVEPEEVRRRLTPRTRVIVLTNLHNPTGVFTDTAGLRAIQAVAREARCRVLLDEVYLEMMFEDAPPSAFHLGPEFVVTSSLTKTYGLSGLRCGWILAEPGLVREIRRLNDLFGVNAPHVMDRLSVRAFGVLGGFRERARALLDRNRPLLQSFLASRPDLDRAPARWASTAFPRLRTATVDALVTRLRRDHETSVVPGRFFGDPGRFRIGVGGDTAMVREGLSRLSLALDSLEHDGTAGRAAT